MAPSRNDEVRFYITVIDPSSLFSIAENELLETFQTPLIRTYDPG